MGSFCVHASRCTRRGTIQLILIFVGLVALASAHRQGGGHKWHGHHNGHHSGHDTPIDDGDHNKNPQQPDDDEHKKPEDDDDDEHEKPEDDDDEHEKPEDDDDDDKPKEGGKHKHHKQGFHHCLYYDSNGKKYNLKRLSYVDTIVMDADAGSLISFSPCGGVHNPACPEGAAVCEVTAQKAIVHGYSSDAHWSDGTPGSGASLAVSYDSDEICENGEKRKAEVQLRCKDPQTISTALTSVTLKKEGCLLSLVVDTPFACDVETICGTIHTQSICYANRDLCEWNEEEELCVPSSRHWRKSLATLICMALIGFGSIGFLCFAATCACFTCLRRSHRLPTTIKTKKPKKPKKVDGNHTIPVEELSLMSPEGSNFEPVYGFQPFPDMPAAHAYSYPMVQIMPARCYASVLASSALMQQ